MQSKIFLLRGTLLGVLFFFSFQIFAQDYNDLQWHRLLLYRSTLTGLESEADDPGFFLDPEGKYSPVKELTALIQGLKDNDPDPKKNAYCRFPARVRWLKTQMSLPESDIECSDYLKFKNRLSAKSVSIVFSSYYLNNPASSFGHTFIRLGKETNESRDLDNTRTELLDTGINYGAMTDGAGPVVFAIGGLAGWFYGNYNAIPYYYKVREYNDFETRDLWSYQLKMSQEEIDMMVDFIWELGHTKFDYYFLTENCSYHVLSILEAVRPSLRLHDRLPSFYTIPSETLKTLDQENLIRKITFRPAPSTLFYHQMNLLSKNEKNEVENLIFKNIEPKNNSPERSALIYDTAISFVDYKYAKDILKGDEVAQSVKRPLLVKRSKIPTRSEELDFSEKLKEAPHLGHGQKRFGLSLVNSHHKNLIDLEWRFAFHDFLDSSIGYPPKTKLEVGKLEVRTDGQDLQIRDFSLVDVMMLGKWDIYNRASSWKIKIGQWQTRLNQEDLSTQGVIGGYGYSYEIGKFSPYILGHLENSYVSERSHKYKLAYGGDIGVVSEFSEKLKLQNALEIRTHPWNESKFYNELRYSNQKAGLGGFYQSFLSDGIQEFGLRFFIYL